MSNKIITVADGGQMTDGSKDILPSAVSSQHDYLDEKYFTLTIVAAIALHIAGIYLWHMMPRAQVIDIPVHALSIKLGDGEPLTAEELKTPQPDSDNKNNVESALAKMVRDQQQQARVMNTMDKAMIGGKENATKAFDKAMNATDTPSGIVESARKLSNVAQQFIRTNAMQAPSSKSSNQGNSSAKEAEMMSRYEQLISLWIEKFKLYPDEARSSGMQGETVVRIRIDRQGNIRYYILEHSTGFPVLDKAATDMVKRANPVPAVPNDYPQGDLIEFLIPVNFHLQ